MNNNDKNFQNAHKAADTAGLEMALGLLVAAALTTLFWFVL